jgi:TctA family transporter
VVTALDGYQMARQGRAGPALATAAIGSFFAGTVATLIIALFAPPLAEIALTFGPAEYFSLMVLGLVASIVLAHGSLLNALGMILIGLLLGISGTDVNSGATRFTLGFTQLVDGIGFVAVAMGLFGIGEIVANLERGAADRHVDVGRIDRLMPSAEERRRVVGPILRGTLLGSALGILPGGGALLAAFGAYTLEKKISKTPEQFGRGAIEGVAAPESANNAGAQTSFIPMLTLGIPSNPTMALMVGAMVIQGIQPGPSVMTERPELFWGLIASMWIGNLMLLVLNLPLVRLWVMLIRVPYHLLYPAIVLFCAIGVFSLSNTSFDVYLLAVFGLFGYVFRKLDAEPAPLLLAFVLGPMMEEFLRRALLLSRGDPTILVTRPVSAAMLAVAAILLLLVVLPALRKTREEAFQE